MDRKHFLKRLLLIGLISALPAVVNAAPPGGGGHSGGGSHGGHSAGGGHSAFAGRGGPRSAGNMHNYRYAYAGNANSWHGTGGSWHGNGGSWHGNGNWHRHGEDGGHHHRFSFGFFPYWYPGWGYYDYGYPYYSDYSYDYPDYYYPNNYYPDNGYSGQNGSASIQALVQDSLARRGYYDGPVDGVVGSGTRSAIREFQRDNGLPVTGRIDSQLVQTLQIGRD